MHGTRPVCEIIQIYTSDWWNIEIIKTDFITINSKVFNEAVALINIDYETAYLECTHWVGAGIDIK